jgi:peroxiredoxin Q/BCP
MSTTKVREGDLAPDFPIPSEDGPPRRLSDFRGESEVVLFFYPKDDTSGCTAEACAFRDAYRDFREIGVEVIGISSDSEASHAAFSSRRRLPYRLVSDADGSIRRRYGVPKTFGLLPGRSTYVIDRSGVVRRVFSSQFRPTRHAGEALEALKTLRQGG